MTDYRGLVNRRPRARPRRGSGSPPSVHPLAPRVVRPGEQGVRRHRRRARPARRAPAGTGPSPRPRRSGATISSRGCQLGAVREQPAADRADQAAARPASTKLVSSSSTSRRSGRRAARAARAGSRPTAGSGTRRGRPARSGGPAPSSPSTEHRARRVREVRPALGRPAYRLLVPPRGDGGVVAGQQHRRDVEPAPGRGLGVDGVLQQPVLVGLLRAATRGCP